MLSALLCLFLLVEYRALSNLQREECRHRKAHCDEMAICNIFCAKKNENHGLFFAKLGQIYGVAKQNKSVFYLQRKFCLL